MDFILNLVVGLSLVLVSIPTIYQIMYARSKEKSPRHKIDNYRQIETNNVLYPFPEMFLGEASNIKYNSGSVADKQEEARQKMKEKQQREAERLANQMKEEMEEIRTEILNEQSDTKLKQPKDTVEVKKKRGRPKKEQG